MTGGALGSVIAQLFHLTAVERETLLVAGVAAVLLAVKLLLFEVEAAERDPGSAS